MRLDQLPPRYREQVERQLNPTTPKQPIFPLPQTARPEAKPSGTGLIKAPPPDTATKTVRKTRQTLTPDQASGLVKAVKVSDDGNEVKIVLAVDPKSIPTAQQKGVFVGKDGRAHFFTKSHIAKAEKALQIALKPHAHLTAEWGKVPVELEMDFYFGYPSGTPKRDLHKIGPMLEKPDGDNLLKGPADSLTATGFWQDDSQISNYLIRKRRTTQTPCIVIKIRNLKPQFEALYRDTEEHDSPTLFNQSNPPPKPAETNPLASLAKGSR